MRRACGGGAGGGAERVQIGCRCEVEGRRRGVRAAQRRQCGGEEGCRGRVPREGAEGGQSSEGGRSGTCAPAVGVGHTMSSGSCDLTHAHSRRTW